MPLVRYQLEDWVEVGDEQCPCGRGLPTIRKVVGRAYDYLVSRTGRKFHGEKVMYLLEHLQNLHLGVRQIQVIQKSLSELTVRVARSDSFQNTALDLMRRYLTEALGHDVHIEFQMVEHIPREPSGKLRIVICNLQGIT